MRRVMLVAGLFLAMMFVAGIAEAGTVTHSAAEDFAGMFDATEVVGTGDAASLQLEALGRPQWEKLSPIEGRYQHGMAYDAEDEAIVVFGGYSPDMLMLGDTWVYRMSTGEWKCMNPTTSPSPRQGHAMVYDAINDRIVLFGGVSYSPSYRFFDDTWTYDLDRNRWTRLDTPDAPEARMSPAMVYDSGNGQIVLFGGQRQYSPHYLNDTWTFDPARGTWSLVGTERAPSPRNGAMACFDDVKGAMVLFGGYIDTSPYQNDETWEFDVSSMTWTLMSPGTSPYRRYGGSLVNLPGTGRSLLFGGYIGVSPYNSNSLWWYDSSGPSWSRVASFGPSGRTNVRMVYSNAAGAFALFGGSGNSVRNDLWGFNPVSEAWSLMWPDVPLPRREFGFVHDGSNDRFILFGGYDNDHFNDTWAYDAGSEEWTLIEATGPLEARFSFDMAYDSTNEVVVLFGGQSRSTYYLGDTWEFNVTNDTWTLTSTSGPTARRCHAMAYDPGADRTVLFGGSSSGTSYRTDTMEYDASDDSWYSGGTGPAGRYDHAMAYLGNTGTVVMFGGRGASDELDDTWEYTASSDTWASKSPTNKPYKRMGHAMAYDPRNNRVYLFGGQESTNLNDTYYYSASGANRYWNKQSPGIHPDGRFGTGMAFDGRGTGVLFGGYMSQHMDDVWHFYSGSSEWQLIEPPSRLKSYRSDLMYDPVGGQVVRFGNGLTPSNLLWQISPVDGALSVLPSYFSSSRPVPVTESHCAIGPMTSDLLVFGGRYYGIGTSRSQNRTWLRSLEYPYWDEVSEDVGPHYLTYTAVEWDVDDNMGVLFGGYYYDAGEHFLDDTWLFDPATETWSQASP
ncbi:MAG: hypothetical protein L0Z54_02165, partial [Thermoplasmata archaeon]|nr:hypothetical protein [Thermoplasmata archaeon]